MVGALLRNWFRRAPTSAGAQTIYVGDLVWFRVQQADHLAVETHWDPQLPTYRRDRTAFRRLFRQGMVLIYRIATATSQIRQAAYAAMPTVTSVPFWRRYLGLGSRDT